MVVGVGVDQRFYTIRATVFNVPRLGSCAAGAIAVAVSFAGVLCMVHFQTGGGTSEGVHQRG